MWWLLHSGGDLVVPLGSQLKMSEDLSSWNVQLIRKEFSSLQPGNDKPGQ